jgi:hypothetical protein
MAIEWWLHFLIRPNIMLDLGLQGIHVLVSGANGGIGRSATFRLRSGLISLGLTTVKLFLRKSSPGTILSRIIILSI